MNALKAKLRTTWTSGDFGEIAKPLAAEAALFISRLGLKPGMKVLDVACGTGNLSLPAARLGANVTGVDIAENLLEQARANAAREGLQAQFDEGDAEALPYEDASFDAVVTMYGAMFAPRPELVAAELLRVTKPGGVIAMANWTPTGFIGQMFKLMAAHVPPPPGMTSPVLWGKDDVVRERFGDGVSKIETTPRIVKFAFPFSPAEVVEHFRVYYGPSHQAFNRLDDEKQAALRKDLEELWTKHNEMTDGTTSADCEYLEVVATRA
jgi:ubiquinone/menaquinone biosynthesis C-methylase UbiE